jgi:hypothetical protein
MGEQTEDSEGFCNILNDYLYLVELARWRNKA